MTYPQATGRGLYYLGPLGRLLGVQVPPEGFDNPINELGVLHTSLNGTQTKDVFGHKRTYTIPLDLLEPRAWSWFEMLFRSAVTPPYYLLDSRRRNRLGATVSSTLSVFNTKTVFTPSSGVVTAVAATATLLPSPGYSVQGPSFAASWVPVAAGTLLAEVNPQPCLPGETVCFSCYVQAGTPTLEIVPYNAALVAQPPATGTTVVSGTPNRRYVTYTVPSSGVVAIRPQLRASAAGTYTTLAWQLADGATPEPWVMGDGIPKVLVDQLGGHAEYLNHYTSSTGYVLQEV
jgi:hypothetical protein